MTRNGGSNRAGRLRHHGVDQAVQQVEAVLGCALVKAIEVIDDHLVEHSRIRPENIRDVLLGFLRSIVEPAGVSQRRLDPEFLAGQWAYASRGLDPFGFEVVSNLAEQVDRNVLIGAIAFDEELRNAEALQRGEDLLPVLGGIHEAVHGASGGEDADLERLVGRAGGWAKERHQPRRNVPVDSHGQK